jgi:hypothetical protein
MLGKTCCYHLLAKREEGVICCDNKLIEVTKMLLLCQVHSDEKCKFKKYCQNPR